MKLTHNNIYAYLGWNYAESFHVEDADMARDRNGWKKIQKNSILIVFSLKLKSKKRSQHSSSVCKRIFSLVFLFFITQKHFFTTEKKLSSTATANSSSFLIKNAYQN